MTIPSQIKSSLCEFAARLLERGNSKAFRRSLRIQIWNLIETPARNYGRVRIATGAMGFKHRGLDQATIMRSLNEPGFLLKIAPCGIRDVQAVISLVTPFLKETTL